jgi:S-adenosylmethionine/arginine decarboxylase-like enzyme
MRIISGPHAVMGAVPGNEGVSATAILDYSSACLHEWPYQYGDPVIHFDLYTCGAVEPSVELFAPLLRPLGVLRLASQLVDRDALSEVIQLCPR